MERIQQKEEILYKDVHGNIAHGNKDVNTVIVQQR